MCLTPRLNKIDKDYLNKEKDHELYLGHEDLFDNCNYIDWDDIPNLNNESKNKLKVLQLNIRGIRNKYIDLIDLLNRLDEPDIIIICETWLKPNDPDPKILDYKFIGRHRSNRKGGGVGFLIKNTLKARTTDLTLNTDSAESLFIEVKGNQDNLLVGSIYRPPNTNVGDFIDSYQVLGEKLHKFKNVLIGLDHNLDLLKTSTHSLMQQFLEATLDAHLIPVITKPIRVTHSSATLIDNILIKSDHCETHRGNVIITILVW